MYVHKAVIRNVKDTFLSLYRAEIYLTLKERKFIVSVTMGSDKQSGLFLLFYMNYRTEMSKTGYGKAEKGQNITILYEKV